MSVRIVGVPVVADLGLVMYKGGGGVDGTPTPWVFVLLTHSDRPEPALQYHFLLVMTSCDVI